MHITSLSSPYGVGDLGPEAYRFADFLAGSGQKIWQVLPINEPSLKGEFSPYRALSAFAGNTLLISPDLLVKEGLLAKSELKPAPRFLKGKAEYFKAVVYRKRIFDLAYENFKKTKNKAKYIRFCAQNKKWLDDFTLFKALKLRYPGKLWNKWPRGLRDRDPKALKKAAKEFYDQIEKEKFLQFIFYQQWFALKKYCNRKGIKFFGDMAIYVEYESTDVWKHPHIFKLDKEKKPTHVSGVPPDYFSRTGQLWGHPVYNWKTLKKTSYGWWLKRMEQNLKLYDLVRIDHFRGLLAYWEVRAGAKTAKRGRWVRVPVYDLFDKLKRHFPNLPIIAEDLGVITPDVHKAMNHYDIPGMRVLLFAFGEDNPWHPYLPENYVPNCLVYTGTHDNNTVRGWFEKEASAEERKRVFKYLGKKVTAREVNWEFIKLALNSVAETAIIPMQDVLGLGAEARMNHPASAKGNWLWRISSGQISSALIKKLLKMTRISGRE